MPTEEAHIARAAAALDDPDVRREATAPRAVDPLREALTMEALVSFARPFADALDIECDFMTPPAPFEDGFDARDRARAALAAAAEDRGAAQMRERAADAVLYLARMKDIGERAIDAPEAAHLIRALPLREPGAT